MSQFIYFPSLSLPEAVAESLCLCEDTLRSKIVLMTMSTADPTARPGQKERVQTNNNYLITKDFDLTVAAVVDLQVPRILERVNLQMKWQTLK